MSSSGTKIGAEKVELDDLLARADFITLHVPLTDKTRNILSKEALAKTKGFLMINLDVRATQTRAIQSFEARGFSRYAVNEHYARVDDAYVTGYYFHKELK